MQRTTFLLNKMDNHLGLYSFGKVNKYFLNCHLFVQKYGRLVVKREILNTKKGKYEHFYPQMLMILFG